MIKATACAGAAVIAALYGAPTFANADTITDYEVINAPAMKAAKASKAVLTEITQTDNYTVAVGDYGVVLYRAAGQNEWQQADVPTSVLFTSVDFVDADHGWAVGHHGVIAATKDGGKSWEVQLNGFEFIELQQQHFQNVVDELTAELDSLDGSDADAEDELAFALDNASFLLEMAQAADAEGPTKPFLDVRAVSQDVIFAVGAYGTLIRSRDGGESWDILDDRLENPDGYHLNALSSDDQYVYVAGEAGQLFRSADLGDSWELLDSPYYGSFFGLHVDSKNRLWVVGLRGNIFVSDDQGDSFNQIKLPDNVNINSVVDAPNGGVYLVGNAGVIGWVDTAGNIKQMTHSSGAALTDLVAHDDGRLTVVGQRGVLEIADFESESSAQTQE
ncbi:YCF48-related protein [Pseudidiomarina andamanensis]|nr:YCF48-related protein [Pseudidiomarina andamanensis]MDS0218432.1 YCF48-related protein [Pseudidiomarina andamanensis]